MAKAPTVDPNQATIDKYKALGLTDAASYVTKGKFDEAKAKTDLIKNVYKLDPALYTDKNFDAATQKYQFEKADVTLPKSKPESFTQALVYYSDILSQAEKFGVNNLNTNYQNALKDAAKLVRDFDSKNLSLDAKQAIANITEASDAIDSINEQRKNVEIQKYRSLGLDVDGVTKIKLSKKELEAARGRLVTEQDTLRRLESTASRTAPKLNESLSRLGLSDIGVNIGSDFSQNKKLATGLEALKAENQLGTGTGGLAGKLNVDVTDDQILNDINTARKSQYKSLYDIGTAATTDLQSQLDQANKIYADLPAGRSKEEAKKSIDAIQSQLTSAQKDTLEAKSLYEGYQPISGEQATSAISKFRESLRLPEERTLKQIDVIDPTIGATVRGLAKQYQAMAETPLGPTTTKQTEDLRNQIEQEAINQLKLGSTLGAEERRQYEQATRSAQSARGNIFGLGPAVQEAANIGAAAEQRKLARYGAAAAFLGSGETTGAATARDLGLRNALDQSRLGAAQGFIASGPTLYNLASQRLGTQQSMLNNYLAASQPLQTGQFQGASSAANPYGYVNPNAGFLGAQNAAGIYNTLADYQAKTYGAYTGAVASQPSGAQNFGAIASGIGSLMPSFAFGA
jgi:uncharacterized protein YdbL (DUF1318 family)